MIYEPGETIVKLQQNAFGGFNTKETIADTHCQVVDIKIFPGNHSFDPLIKEVENVLYSKSNSALKESGLKTLMNSKEYIEATGKYIGKKGEKLEGVTLIRIMLIQYRSIGLGDKLTNRHGAKGVVAQILPDDQMPVLPDGRHVDVCLNPLGVISRMNVGQLIEMHVGNILDRTRKWLEENQNNTQKCIDMLCELFTLMDGYHDKRLSKQTTGMLKSLPKQEQESIIQGYIKNGVKLIFPTFENPKMSEINKAAQLVGAELESKLYLPKYGRETMYPVTWGLLYILKLEHISSTKQNIRTVGSYKGTTNMPNKPGQGKNALRIGEQDSWAYLAYNHGEEILKDMFLVNSDNPAIRQDVIKQIYEHGSVESFKESDYASLKSGASVAFDVYSI